MHDGQLMSKREDYTYEVLGSNKPHSDTARTISVNAAMPIARAIEENWGRASAIEPG